jgi:hypothetical protein
MRAVLERRARIRSAAGRMNTASEAFSPRAEHTKEIYFRRDHDER